MSLTDIVYRVNELASSWEQFKLINDHRLRGIESKGQADSTTIEQLCKINGNIDNCKKCLDLIETAAQRSEVSTDFNINDKYFSDYIRKGVESLLSRKTLSGDDKDIGGYLITPHIVKRINKGVTEMRQICSNQRISAETLGYIIEDLNRASAGCSGETVDDEDVDSKSKYDFAKDIDTPKIQKICITTYELYAQPQISQKLLVTMEIVTIK